MSNDPRAPWGVLTFTSPSMFSDPADRADFAQSLVRFCDRIGARAVAIAAGDAPRVELVLYELPATPQPLVILTALMELSGGVTLRISPS